MIITNFVNMENTINKPTGLAELKLLAENMRLFSVDDFKILTLANGNKLPTPGSNLANIFRSAAADGIIEQAPGKFEKSKWKGANRAGRQLWRKRKGGSI